MSQEQSNQHEDEGASDFLTLGSKESSNGAKFAFLTVNMRLLTQLTCFPVNLKRIFYKINIDYSENLR